MCALVVTLVALVLYMYRIYWREVAYFFPSFLYATFLIIRRVCCMDICKHDKLRWHDASAVGVARAFCREHARDALADHPKKQRILDAIAGHVDDPSSTLSKLLKLLPANVRPRVFLLDQEHCESRNAARGFYVPEYATWPNLHGIYLCESAMSEHEKFSSAVNAEFAAAVFGHEMWHQISAVRFPRRGMQDYGNLEGGQRAHVDESAVLGAFEEATADAFASLVMEDGLRPYGYNAVVFEGGDLAFFDVDRQLEPVGFIPHKISRIKTRSLTCLHSLVHASDNSVRGVVRTILSSGRRLTLEGFTARFFEVYPNAESLFKEQCPVERLKK